MGVEQLCTKREKGSSIVIIVEKVVDDSLMAGEPPVIRQFVEELHAQFELGTSDTGKARRFLGCLIINRPDNSV